MGELEKALLKQTGSRNGALKSVKIECVYIRKVKSRNSVCFQIGYKENRRFKLVEHVGCAQTVEEIEALKIKAKQRLQRLKHQDQLSLFPQKGSATATLVDWQIIGFHDVFGVVYNEIGFPRNLLRDLVVARIVYPKSKLATIRYLKQNLGISVKKDQVYRFLDSLDREELTEIAFKFVSDRNQGLSLVFYDVTTLYFESSREGILRQKGYSKDHRHDMPQVLIGPFVDQDGSRLILNSRLDNYSKVKVDLEKKGQRLDEFDLLIDATAPYFSLKGPRDWPSSFREKVGILTLWSWGDLTGGTSAAIPGPAPCFPAPG